MISMELAFNTTEDNKMSNVDWLDVLGLGKTELDDLRFIGYSYIKQGHYKIALKFFESLVILSKNALYDLQTLGALYLQMGNNLSALNYLEQAVKLDPKDPTTLINRAKALLLLGYQRQGLLQAETLQHHSDEKIASQATALVLAYSK